MTNRNRILVALFVSWAAALEAADTPKARRTTIIGAPGRSIIGLQNGVYVALSREETGHSFSTHVVAGSIARAFTDPETCTYFGYEIAAKPAEEGRVEVRLGPLGPKGEERVRQALALKCTDPRALAAAAPRFPAPQTLGDGEGLSIDLLTHPKTGSTVSDRVRVSMRPFPAVQPRSDEPVKELHVEDLSFGVFPTGRLLIDGKEQETRVGCRGPVIYLWLPGRQRFVFSLVPREGYDFRKAGIADGDRIVFTWDGVQYEWIGQEPVVSGGVRCAVWIMKDDRIPKVAESLGDTGCGAGPVNNVLEGK